MNFLNILLVFLAGAFAWRIRGADLLPNDTVARFVVWGGTVGILIFILTLNPYYGLASVLLSGIGASLGYYGQFDITQPANRTIKNYVILSLTAMFRFTPLAIGAAFVGSFLHVLPAVLSGTLFVPVYFLGTKLPTTPKLSGLFNQFTCWGEFLFGGIILSALYLGFVL